MSFLGLPTELRVQIYALIIPDSFRSRWHCGYLYTRTLSIPDSILLVSKQIRDEAIETLFRTQQVDIWSPALSVQDASPSSITLSGLESRHLQALRLSFDIRTAARRDTDVERASIETTNVVKHVMQQVFSRIYSLARLKKLVVELRVREPTCHASEFPDYFGVLLDHKVSERRYRDQWHSCNSTEICIALPREDDVVNVILKLLEFT